jgi:hypothetical protein
MAAEEFVTGPYELVKKYIGLSTQLKPKNIPIGAEFFETDSNKTYVTTDGITWIEKKETISSLTQAVVLYEDGSVLYVCRAEVGIVKNAAKWQIMKVDTTSGVVIQWCDSNTKYDNQAIDLPTVAALSYG